MGLLKPVSTVTRTPIKALCYKYFTEIMYLKIFRAVWFLSLLAFLATLLLTYAGLNERVMVPYLSGQSSVYVTFSREAFFYFFLGLGALVNVLVYVVRGTMNKKDNEPFRTWFHGLLITLHLFFIIEINFLELFNSRTEYNYGNIGFVIYGSVVLMVLWALGWPLYLMFSRSGNKQLI